MTHKKGKFMTFLFALIPGAGQMYMGFMKMGVSLMATFATILLVGGWLNIPAFFILAPIVWFYSFFDAINRASLDKEEFYTLEDHYCFSSDIFVFIQQIFHGKGRSVLALILIFIGIDILWQNISWMFLSILPTWLEMRISSLFYRIPQILTAFIVLYAGFWLIQNKKKELELEDHSL